SRSRLGRLRLLTVHRSRNRECGKCEEYTQSELRSAQTELPYVGLGQSVHGRFRSEHTPPGLYAQRSLGNLATKQRPACDIQANLRGESGVNQRQINGVRTDARIQCQARVLSDEHKEGSFARALRDGARLRMTN